MLSGLPEERFIPLIIFFHPDAGCEAAVKEEMHKVPQRNSRLVRAGFLRVTSTTNATSRIIEIECVIPDKTSISNPSTFNLDDFDLFDDVDWRVEPV